MRDRVGRVSNRYHIPMIKEKTKGLIDILFALAIIVYILIAPYTL